MLSVRNLINTTDLTADDITQILDTARSMEEINHRTIKKVPALRGRTIVNLFLEASTRTRSSFEIAEKRLSADSLNVQGSSSSAGMPHPCASCCTERAERRRAMSQTIAAAARASSSA